MTKFEEIMYSINKSLTTALVLFVSIVLISSGTVIENREIGIPMMIVGFIFLGVSELFRNLYPSQYISKQTMQRGKK